MSSLQVVEHLCVLAHVLPGFFARAVETVSHPRPFQQVEKDSSPPHLHGNATPADAGLKVVGLHEVRSELCETVGGQKCTQPGKLAGDQRLHQIKSRYRDNRGAFMAHAAGHFGV